MSIYLPLMSNKLIKLAERRATLVARSAHQRTEVAQAMAAWHRPLALADKGLEVVHYLRRHRNALLAGSMLIAAIWRPRSMLGWLRRGWGVWRMALAVRRRLSG